MKIIRDISLETVYDYGTIKFEVGEAEMHNLPRGIDLAVKKMQRNEVSRIGCSLDMGLSV